MKVFPRGVCSLLLLVLGGLSMNAAAEGEAPYSGSVGQNYPKEVFFGDTHLHTRNSADAWSMGNLNLTPGDAYRFAQGSPVLAHNGMQVQLRRPLDFLVVSDHAEYLGAFYRFNVNDSLITKTDVGRQWQTYVEEGDLAKFFGAFVNSMQNKEEDPALPAAVRQTVWSGVAKTADRHNKPGVFTAFSGYEWTSMISGNNLHRVVVFKDDADKVSQMIPFSGQDSLDPRDLWQALANYETATGGEVLSIAHNGNLSNGMMFPDETVGGSPIDEAYASLRARFETVYEVTQVKGDGEAHPVLSPDDEFADFENWDWDNIGRTQKKEDWMLPQEYARGALKRGLRFEDELGVNPFKIGLIGSTDGHNSISTPEEDNFFGKFPESEPGPARLENAMALDRLWQNSLLVASGYAAVWAKENTRAAIFDAIKRREVYATTGSRIKVRFFSGWEFDETDIHRPAMLDIAYGTGVPMGGDLSKAKRGQVPKFLVIAAMDADGARLDRIQIIKGWMDKAGKLQEKVYDVAWSDDRKLDKRTGKLPAVGNTVDVENATYLNTIGAPQLSTYWEDPDFDRAERAFYYARVLEIPTPRWTTYDSAYFNVELQDDVPSSIQDRAYTSPIWYTP
ncbi:DUF3604 domain-containing protein [Pseudomonadales bacterium]|jgi:hypothetical protein|nr:DUF3604 domain-containing protein [Pseudomonadales bacterium]MDC0892509.1 DUF3604 domain-containing protein [Pseudomonadales bacterium]